MKYPFLLHLYQYRRYIGYNAWNELRYRYAGTGMGIFWNIIHPIIVIALYSIVFSWIFPHRTRGDHFVLYLTSGLLAWRVFSDTILRGSNTFIENAHYLKRLAIPAEVFVAKMALTTTFVLFIYYLVFLPITMLLGNQFGWEIFLLPVVLLCLQGLAFGMILILATLRALFPDIHEFLQAFLPLWFWTLPVVYPETIVPVSFRDFLPMNPPYIFIHSIRQVVLEHRIPDIKNWLIMAVWLLVFLRGGVALHAKFQTEVKEVI